jgi:hypothetical protein
MKGLSKCQRFMGASWATDMAKTVMPSFRTWEMKNDCSCVARMARAALANEPKSNVYETNDNHVAMFEHTCVSYDNHGDARHIPDLRSGPIHVDND